MFDMHSELKTFYEDYVRLGKKRHDDLARVRDTNLTRLKSGLDALGEKLGTKYAYFKEARDQGGYAMRTLNQHPNDEYDLDEGLIFDAQDLPDEPAASRQRVCNAFKEMPGNFRRPPKARTNAVTVWYADGPHLDFAIYRQRKDIWGKTIIEHAGGDQWTERDPDAVTKWFHERVDVLSPNPELYTVEAGQLRRIVRFLKFFCRSRVDWDLPGGMITTALVVECYRAGATRDDVALHETMDALHRRLAGRTTVLNPVDPSQNLTEKSKYRDQVEALHNKLDWALDKLAVLHASTCTEARARNAWRQVFNHSFWNSKAEPTAKDESLLRPAAAASGYAFPNRPTGPVKPAGFA